MHYIVLYMLKCICVRKVRMPIQLLHAPTYVQVCKYVVHGISAHRHVIQFFPTERVKDMRSLVLFCSLHNHMAFTTVTAALPHCFLTSAPLLMASREYQSCRRMRKTNSNVRTYDARGILIKY